MEAAPVAAAVVAQGEEERAEEEQAAREVAVLAPVVRVLAVDLALVVVGLKAEAPAEQVRVAVREVAVPEERVQAAQPAKAALENGFPPLQCCGARHREEPDWPVQAASLLLPKKTSARCLLYSRSSGNPARNPTPAWTHRLFNRD